MNANDVGNSLSETTCLLNEINSQSNLVDKIHIPVANDEKACESDEELCSEYGDQPLDSAINSSLILNDSVNEIEDEAGELNYEPSEPDDEFQREPISESDSKSLHSSRPGSSLEPADVAKVKMTDNSSNVAAIEPIVSEEDKSDDESAAESDNGSVAIKRDDLEEGEIDELEEGEVKDEDDGDLASVSQQERRDSQLCRQQKPMVVGGQIYSTSKFGHQIEKLNETASASSLSSNINRNTTSTHLEQIGVCKFFLRGQCTWGDFCKFIHPTSSGADGLKSSYNTSQGPSTDQNTYFRDVPPPPIAQKNSTPTTPVSTGAFSAGSTPRLLPPPPVPPTVASVTETQSTVGVVVGGGSASSPDETSAWERAVKQTREKRRGKKGGETLNKTETGTLGSDLEAVDSEDENLFVAEQARPDFESKVGHLKRDFDDGPRQFDPKKMCSQKKPHSTDTLRYFNETQQREAARQQEPRKYSIEDKKPEKLPNTGVAALQRAALETDREWRDPWMRGTTAAVPTVGTAMVSDRKSRRSRSGSNISKSSFSSVSSSGKSSLASNASSRRRRRSRLRRLEADSSGSSSPGSRSRSTSAASSRTSSALSSSRSARRLVAETLHDAHQSTTTTNSGVKIKSLSAKSSEASASDSLSEQEENFKRRSTAKRKVKKMDEGRRSSLSNTEDKVVRSSSDLSQTSDVAEDEEDPSLVTKKGPIHNHKKFQANWKPIKMKIVSKSRVQLPASYAENASRFDNDDEMESVLTSKRPLSPLSPRDIDSDEDIVLAARRALNGEEPLPLSGIKRPRHGSPDDVQKMGGAKKLGSVHLENISSSEADDDDDDDENRDDYEGIGNRSDVRSLSPASIKDDNDVRRRSTTSSRERVTSSGSENSLQESRSPVSKKPPPMLKSSSSSSSNQTANSRREEILRQLRAVEDAIAKKRSMKSASSGNSNETNLDATTLA